MGELLNAEDLQQDFPCSIKALAALEHYSVKLLFAVCSESRTLALDRVFASSGEPVVPLPHSRCRYRFWVFLRFSPPFLLAKAHRLAPLAATAARRLLLSNCRAPPAARTDVSSATLPRSRGTHVQQWRIPCDAPARNPRAQSTPTVQKSPCIPPRRDIGSVGRTRARPWTIASPTSLAPALMPPATSRT